MSKRVNGRWDPTTALAEQQGNGAGIIAGAAPSTSKAMRLPDGDLVYQTNKWSRYLWREFKDGAADAAEVETAGTDKLPRWPAFMREVFNRFYSEDPQQVEQVEPEHQWAQRAHDEASQLPEFERLKDRCMGDKLWSGLAATAITDEVLRVLPEPDEPLEDPRPHERRVKGLEGLQDAGVPVGDELAKAKQALANAQQQAQQYAQGIDPSRLRQALRRGSESAQDSIDEAQNAISSFGYDLSDGSDGRGGDIEGKRKLFAKVKSSKKLRALAELAGRMRRFAAQKQRSKADQARDEISDVTLGDDLARLLPSEAAKLSQARTLFFKDLIERKLLCYELKGSEPQNKGPIVVCVDNSGSMSGDRELWSKAVALALLDVAKRQNRSFALVHFDTRVRCSMIWERGPNAPEWDKIVEAMEYFSGGGTDFEPPLRKALELLEGDTFKKADVILVTDGAAGTGFADEYRQRAKAKEATTYGVEIGGYGYGDSDVMGAFCDHTMSIDDLDIDNAATQQLFEI